MTTRTFTIVFGITLVLALTAGIASAQVALTPQEQLGKDIFFDNNLSINMNQSCAACHAPEAGWTGPISTINAHGSVYEGSIAGRFGNRKPPSSAYATQSPVLSVTKDLFVGGNFWDGRATGEKLGNPAADQAQGPFLNPLEQALGSPIDVIGRICTSMYADSFLDVCGPTACDQIYVNNAYDCVGLSVAAYEASPEVNPFSSKFDAVMFGKAKFTKLERKGFSLFMGKGKCNKCHTMSPLAKPVLFTDYTFDNLGVPRNPENPFYTQYDFNPAGADWLDLGLGGFLWSRMDYMPYADANYGKHKVPTLRNVDKRPSSDFVKAYGHNGYFKNLKRIVHFYNTRDVLPQCSMSVTDAEADMMGCWPPPEVTQNVNTAELGDLGLTEDQEWALVEFMKTLSDGWEKP
jgi:cytochrome c peroxidase